MARKKKKPQSPINFPLYLVVSIVLSACILITLNDKLSLGMTGMPSWNDILNYIGVTLENIPTSNSTARLDGESKSGESKDGVPVLDFVKPDNSVSVHILDMGQADSILIRTEEQNVLIDAGDVDMGEDVLAYLSANGVDRIDLLIATHPHADHIGGMDEVVENIEIGAILMSKLPEKTVPTTRVYTDLLTAIVTKGYKVTWAEAGKQYDLGGGAMLRIIAPAQSLDDLNEMSVVSRLDYKDTSFLFTGDSSKKSENAILKSGLDVDVDVLSLAHHGSNTSTQQKYLDAVSPELVSISVGEDNSYGHPHREVLSRLNDFGAKIYRTDVNGTIIFSSDGYTIDCITKQ